MKKTKLKSLNFQSKTLLTFTNKPLRRAGLTELSTDPTTTTFPTTVFPFRNEGKQAAMHFMTK